MSQQYYFFMLMITNLFILTVTKSLHVYALNNHKIKILHTYSLTVYNSIPLPDSIFCLFLQFQYFPVIHDRNDDVDRSRKNVAKYP